ncbi:MAG TPA: SAM-dependent chlorinase/fluorinase, partial [Gemmatimonadales bacterium]|nr:SAM-dependent chlorinase/fluorinase [Gemmatimonadales bacterium]
MAIITLLTDFGTADSYVAEVKAVLLSRDANLTLVDISHEVPPGDVRAGQYLLSRAWQHFPKGTIHLAIIDPGVGTERRAIAAESAGHRFLAPDNGLLSFLPRESRFVSVLIPPGVSATFHGRDVFAPAAATLAAGDPITALGSSITSPVYLPLPVARHDGTAVVGEVIYVDRFGTLISNINASGVEPGVRIRVGDTDVGPLRRTFADVPRGALVAFVGSGGTIEVAVRDGSAARMLGVGVGVGVEV